MRSDSHGRLYMRRQGLVVFWSQEVASSAQVVRFPQRVSWISVVHLLSVHLALLKINNNIGIYTKSPVKQKGCYAREL